MNTFTFKIFIVLGFFTSGFSYADVLWLDPTRVECSSKDGRSLRIRYASAKPSCCNAKVEWKTVYRKIYISNSGLFYNVIDAEKASVDLDNADGFCESQVGLAIQKGVLLKLDPSNENFYKALTIESKVNFHPGVMDRLRNLELRLARLEKAQQR